jgi:hypothetical protein
MEPLPIALVTLASALIIGNLAIHSVVRSSCFGVS